MKHLPFWHTFLAVLAAAVSACGGDDAVPMGVLSISTDAVDYGSIPVGTSSTQTFDLHNTGTGPVELQSITLIEGSLSIFDVQWSRVTELEAGGSLTVTVRFAPTKEQGYSGRIQIRSDDAVNPSLLVSVAGEGAPSTVDDDGDGYAPADGDCNDSDAAIHPGNTEVCDGKDNDCDGVTPAGEADADGDGQRGCATATTPADCDDTDRDTYSGAPEICDGENQDNDCDGVAADDDDLDGDGYSVCGYVGEGEGLDQGDCDDGEARSAPGLEEVCEDAIDNDCDGQADNIDEDGDGFSQCDPIPDCDEDPDSHPVYVDGSYGGGSSTGTPAEPYTGLGDALEALGDSCRTVYVYAGSYTVSIKLETGLPLTIRGEDASSVVLEPDGENRQFWLTRGSLELESLTLSGGVTPGGEAGSDGGAILAQLAGVTLREVIASGNSASADGGAVAVQSAQLSLEGCTFSGNEAGDDGGAVVVVNGAFSDDGSEYRENQGVQGGAISLQSSSASMQNLSFFSNLASDAGGAISAIQSAEGTGFALERSIFGENTALNYGGAVALDDVSDSAGYVRNCILDANDGGEQGGGMWLTDVDGLEISNNTLADNRVSGAGAGILVQRNDSASSSLSLRSNIIAWNNGQSGLYVEPDGQAVSYNTVALTSSGTDYAGTVSAGTDENTDDNPDFVTFSNDANATDDDLHLKSGSSSIDSGVPDADYNDPDGSRNDRGAYGGPRALD